MVQKLEEDAASRRASQVAAVLFTATTNPPNMDKEDDVGSWIGFAELPTFSLISLVGGLEYHGRIRIVKSSAVIIQHVTYLSLVSFLPEPCVRVLRRTPRLRLALPQR